MQGGVTVSFNYLDILKQICDLLRSIDKSLKEGLVLLEEIRNNTDPTRFD